MRIRHVQLLGIVYRAIATHLIHKASHNKQTAHTGAVTLVQCFGSALNLNIHFHMLFLDGVYIADTKSVSARFHQVSEPTNGELTQLAHQIAYRVGHDLERSCRYIARPVVSEQRLSLTAQGKGRYQLKTSYADRTTHVIFEPLDFLSRLGRGNKAKAAGPEDATPVPAHAAMSWAQRLKRVFDIDLEMCRVCGGSMKVFACIQNPKVIKKILTHLRSKGLYLEAAGLPQSRAPPQDDLFS